MRVAGVVRSAVVGVTLAAVAVTGGVVANSALAREAAQAAPGDPALGAALDRLLADARLTGATVGLHVRVSTTGAEVYSRNEGQRVIPASNEKLLTSAAALEVLGPDYRFHTRVRHSGRRTGGTVNGNLYLQGTGDPTATAAVYDKIAKAVRAAGIRKVTGNLVADDTWFDGVPMGTDWAWEDETYHTNAPISALTVAADDDFNAGSVAVRSRPGTAAGRAAKITIEPAGNGLKLVNRAVTGAAGSADTVTAHRPHGTKTIVVTGSSPLRATTAGIDLVSAPDSTAYAAAVFRAALKKRGVTVVKGTVVKATPGTARMVVDHPSMTLGKLLTPFLKLSNNGHAEVLVKAMGRHKSGAGTWGAGLDVARAALRRLGVDTSVIMTVDGSGLSRRDWLTTGQLTNLLIGAQQRPWFTTWHAALPVAGNPDRMVGGTLRSRMAGTPAANNLHAKTGTLTGVNALSGYVTDRTGRRLAFSMVVNNVLTPDGSTNATALLDSVAVTLASSGEAVTLLQAPRVPAVPVATRDGEDVECSWVAAC